MSLPASDLGDLRRDLPAATQRLLGDTITLSTQQWQSPCAVPGWMRAHIAAHLSHHARALTAMAHALMETNQAVRWLVGEHDDDIMAEGLLDALTLQEDLDASAAHLMVAFDAMSPRAWNCSLLTSQGPLPAGVLPLVRLNEVILHHIDLDVGYTFSDIDPQVADRLLRWNLFRAEQRFSDVCVRITTDDHEIHTVGTGRVVELSGSVPSVLGWITGRLGATAVLGAAQLPPVELV